MMTNAQPVAYIRRSVASRADPGDVSREFQTGEIRRLAGDDAVRLVIIDRDWGRSAATDKTDRRLAFLALLESIEAGNVSALYAYSTDRLARSVEWSARLLNACRRAGVPIVTRTGRIEPGNADAALLFHVLAAANENALSGMEAKARATVASRQARNLEAGLEPNAGMGRLNFGQMPGEDPAAVLAAFDAAGSFLGAAKALNASGVRPRLGGKWSVRTVARIIRRERPDAPHPPSECPLRPERGKPGWADWTGCPHPHTARQGARTLGRHILSGLLHCGGTYPDGRTCRGILSTMPRPDGRSPAYYCNAGKNDDDHSRPIVCAERKILPWVRDEIAHLDLPYDTVGMASGNAAARDALAAERARILRQNVKGYISDAELDAGMDEITAALDRLGAAEAVFALPEINWEWQAVRLNSALRLILERVILGPDMRPLPFPDGFVWRDRALRAD